MKGKVFYITNLTNEKTFLQIKEDVTLNTGNDLVYFANTLRLTNSSVQHVNTINVQTDELKRIVIHDMFKKIKPLLEALGFTAYSKNLALDGFEIDFSETSQSYKIKNLLNNNEQILKHLDVLQDFTQKLILI